PQHTPPLIPYPYTPTAPPHIYTLSLHDALPIWLHRASQWAHHHLQHPGEHPRRPLSTDVGADRLGRRRNRQNVAVIRQYVEQIRHAFARRLSVFRLAKDGHIGRMSRLDFRRRVDEMHRVVHGDRGLGRAGGDELELARVGDDVPGREDAGDVGGHRLRHLDLALLDLEPPFGDGAERGDEAELRDDAIDGHALLLLRLVVDDRRTLDPVAAVDLLQLPDRAQLHLSRGGQLLHLLDRRGVGAEPVAAVDHQDPPRHPLQVHRPVERGVTADDLLTEVHRGLPL